MRKLIVTEFMSLDGVIESPMWTLPYWNDEIAAFKAEETSNNQPILLGRVTYDGFAQAWPERTDVESGGVYFNGTRKYVVSTTLHTADWNNSVIIRDNVVEQIRTLKQEEGADIVVHGSANLVQTLMQHDVVDQYRFLIYPVVLGKGQRLFQDNALKLRLVESRAFSSGVVAVVYEPDRSK